MTADQWNVQHQMLLIVFGPSGYLTPGTPLTRHEALTLIKDVVHPRTYERYRRKYSVEKKKWDQTQDEVEKEYSALVDNEPRDFMRILDFLRRTVPRYNHLRAQGWKATENVQNIISNHLDTLGAGFGLIDANGKAKRKLHLISLALRHADAIPSVIPPLLKAALTNLRNNNLAAQEFQELWREARVAVEYLSPEETLEFRVRGCHDQASLPDGTGWLQCKTEAELYSMLGMQAGRFPFVARWIDPKGVLNGFNQSAGSAFDFPQLVRDAEHGDQTLVPFTPLLHQVLAVVHFVNLAMENKPCLEMDEVGVGKTVIILLAMSTIAYFVKTKADTGRFPGLWGEPTRRLVLLRLISAADKHFKGSHEHCTGNAEECLQRFPDQAKTDGNNFGNFSQNPFLVTAPPTLIAQWTKQAYVFLDYKSWQVFPYVSVDNANRALLWQYFDSRTQLQRLVLASTTVSHRVLVQR